MRNRLIGPRILEARDEIGPAKSCSKKFAAKQGCGSLLFLVLWRIIKFATAVQATHNIESLRSAASQWKEPEISFPSRIREQKLEQNHTHELPESSQDLG